jgi:hypothetical protein
MNLSARETFLHSVAGICWGGLVYLLGNKALGPGIWSGVLASPLIGLIVGRLMQPRFENSSTGVRWLTSLVTLYFAATLFGLVVGSWFWFAQTSNSRVLERCWEGLASTWYGCTLFLPLLWPLAYFTHWAIEHGDWFFVRRTG